MSRVGDDRVAVVTGAGRGIGRAIALRLAGQGVSVVVNDIGVSADALRYRSMPAGNEVFGLDADSTEVAETVAEEIRGNGGQAIADLHDISDTNGAEGLIAAALQHFGRVDVVVNNAGVLFDGPIEATDPSTLRTLLAVHVEGPFHLVRTAWKHLQHASKPRVLNVGSVAGPLIGVPGHVAYDTSKAAVVGLTRSLAAEGAPHGIQVNGLLPYADTRSSMSIARSYRRQPGLTPSSVAEAAAWLVDPTCPHSGRFVLAGGPRSAAMFAGVTAGFVSDSPDGPTADEIALHWDDVEDMGCTVVPENAADLSKFAIRVTEEHLGAIDQAPGGPR